MSINIPTNSNKDRYYRSPSRHSHRRSRRADRSLSPNRPARDEDTTDHQANETASIDFAYQSRPGTDLLERIPEEALEDAFEPPYEDLPEVADLGRRRERSPSPPDETRHNNLRKARTQIYLYNLELDHCCQPCMISTMWGLRQSCHRRDGPRHWGRRKVVGWGSWLSGEIFPGGIDGADVDEDADATLQDAISTPLPEDAAEVALQRAILTPIPADEDRDDSMVSELLSLMSQSFSKPPPASSPEADALLDMVAGSDRYCCHRCLVAARGEEAEFLSATEPSERTTQTS